MNNLPTGCWASIFIRLDWVLLGLTAFYKVAIGFYRVLLCLIGFYWVIIGFSLVLLGFYWVLLGFTGFYWVLLGLTGFYWIVPISFYDYGPKNHSLYSVVSYLIGAVNVKKKRKRTFPRN